jgi:hypothetical protein
MANYNEIINLYLNGKARETICKKLKVSAFQVSLAIQEFNKSNRETTEDKIMQIRSIECKLFEKIEEEKYSGKKDKSIDSLKHVYSNYLIN